MKEFPDQFGFSVSHTTRKPRPGEQDGVHYNFVEKPNMEDMIERGDFIEYARVHANIYGTSIAAVRAVNEAGKTCLLDIDVQGAELVKKTDLGARFHLQLADATHESGETAQARRLRQRVQVEAESSALRWQAERILDASNPAKKPGSSTPSSSSSNPELSSLWKMPDWS